VPPDARTLPDADGVAVTLADAELLHEVPDGRVWTPLFGRPALLRLDFTTGAVDTLGTGDGADALTLPFAVTDGGDGTLVVFDAAGGRAVGFDVDGRRLGSRAVPAEVPVIRARTDTRGDWAWTIPVLGADSARLLWHAANTTSPPDTLGALLVPAATVRLPAGDRAIEMAPEGAPRDLWGLLGDGTVWIARSEPFAVEFRLPDGTRTLGGPRPYTPIPSTDADRGTLRGLPAPPEVSVEAIRYAETKGPFLEARAFPDGAVWTWLTQSAPRNDERYAVFRPGRAESDVIVLPRHHRVVGGGAAHVYVGTRNPDGTWRVTRHPRPDLPR
jgi:hypothetical protein